jgi:hypothetical protein
MPIASPIEADLRLLRWFAGVAWTGSSLAILSLWLQYQFGVYHTNAWLWLPLTVIGVTAGVSSLFLGLIKMRRLGGRRGMIFKWITAGTTPLLLLIALAGYMVYERNRSNLPNTAAHKVGRMAAVTLIDLHARLRYPHRLETARLVMYYDDQITDPTGDVVAAEAHLARLEKILGRRQHSRIHWIRGSALGQQPMAIHSITIGSESGPADLLDRHELAHALLYQFSVPQADPPKLLLEGWAMAVDGHPEPLAETALFARQQLAELPGSSALRKILSPDLYHVGLSEAYEIGGAFVDFLLRRYGAEKFLAFYNLVHPENYESVCEQVFKASWDTLEQAFWAEMERSVRADKSRMVHGDF